MLLTSAFVAAWLELGLPVGSLRIMRESSSLPFPQEAKAGGLQVSIGGTNLRSAVITRGNERFTFTPPPGEICDDPAITPDGRRLFFLVRSQLDFGYDYACILRFDFTSGSLASTQPSRLLSQAQLTNLFGGKRTWVNNLYQVGPAGDRLLLNISSEDPSRTTQGSSYYPALPY